MHTSRMFLAVAMLILFTSSVFAQNADTAAKQWDGLGDSTKGQHEHRL